MFFIYLLLFAFFYLIFKVILFVWRVRRILHEQAKSQQHTEQQRGAGVYKDESATSTTKPHKPVFSDDEGEYVEFEEIK